VRLTKPVWIRVDELLTFVALLAPLGALLAAFGFPGVGIGIMLVPCAFTAFSDFFPFMNAGGLVFEESGLRLSVARAECLVPWTCITRVEIIGPDTFQMVELDFEALDRVVASVVPDTPRNRTRARQMLDRPGEAGGHIMLSPWTGGLDGQTLERAAVEAGWEYKTCWPPSVAASEKLAVAINGTLFSTDRPKWQIWSGSLSRSEETVIANREINHIDPNSYLLWFDDQLRPTLEKRKPPSLDTCARAKWGISGQGVAVDHGVVSASAGHVLDSRTVLGVNREKKLLILAVFDSASQYRAAEMIAEHGASDVILVDGGSSTCLTFGSIPAGLGRRTAVFPYRAVATVFGVGFTKSQELNGERP
jgi:hypothetical protein